MRSSDFWDHAGLQVLEDFAGETSGKGFNRFGMLRFEERKKIHGETLMDQIESYFGGTLPSVQTTRDGYFCSELVTAAFIRVGIIDESAAPAFRPETMSPNDIAKDKAFGFFVGYLLSSPAYRLTDDDYFRTAV